MKKIKLFLAVILTIVVSTAFSQGGFYSVYIAPTTSANFTTSVPAGTLVYVESSNQLYSLSVAVGRDTDMDWVLASASRYSDMIAGAVGTVVDSNYVKTTTAQNVYGVKTFYSSPGAAIRGISTNTGFGAWVLESATTGWGNTGYGYKALRLATTGYRNTAIGDSALPSLTTGDDNIAIGNKVMMTHNTGNGNIAIGNSAMLIANSTSSIAIGTAALAIATGGASNTAIGHGSQTLVTTGDRNTSFGIESLAINSTGNDNVAIGYRAGYNELSSNKLIIHNAVGGSDTALIYGDFSARTLQLNALVACDSVTIPVINMTAISDTTLKRLGLICVGTNLYWGTGTYYYKLN